MPSESKWSPLFDATRSPSTLPGPSNQHNQTPSRQPAVLGPVCPTRRELPGPVIGRAWLLGHVEEARPQQPSPPCGHQTRGEPRNGERIALQRRPPPRKRDEHQRPARDDRRHPCGQRWTSHQAQLLPQPLPPVNASSLLRALWRTAARSRARIVGDCFRADDHSGLGSTRSNPHPAQGHARRRVGWCARRESNPRHLACKASALAN
jgi:hypothetical protein